MDEVEAAGIGLSLVHTSRGYSVVMGSVVDKAGRHHVSGASTNQVAPSALVQGF